MAIYRGTGGFSNVTGTAEIEYVTEKSVEIQNAVAEVEQLAAEITSNTSAAQASADTAVAASNGVQGFAAVASTKAGEAQVSAANAATSALNASVSATNASNSATSSANSATTATTQAELATTNGAAQVALATTQAANAANSATAAASSASSASSSATAATTKASEAATSATNAANSATASATSATAAASSASSASTSATNAATSATTATTKANEASASATSAANSALTAQQIVTNVSTLYPTIKPSLNLDFANMKEMPDYVTFSRATTSTRFNERGLLEEVPAGKAVFEHDPITGECLGYRAYPQATNLLTHSNQFDNAAWGKARATVSANVTTAPDGTLTADKLVEDAAASTTHYCQQTIAVTAGTVYTASCFFKASERSSAAIRFASGGLTWGAVGVEPTFIVDLVNGTVTNIGGVGVCFVLPVGGGWYRVLVTATAQVSESVPLRMMLSSSGSVTYTGDGFSGIYIYGAQLEVGSVATPYIPSTETFTGRASTATFIGSDGLIQTAASNVERLQYNTMDLSIKPFKLYEEQRTNLALYSGDFSNAVWTKIRATVSVAAVASPLAFGSVYKLTEDTSNGEHYVGEDITVTSTGTTHTVTWVFAPAGRTTIVFYNYSVPTSTTYIGIAYNTLTGVFDDPLFSGGAMLLDKSATKLANGFYKISLTYTLGGAETVIKSRATLFNGSTSYTGDGTSGIYIAAMQLEAGSYPTSYIPTTTAAVTRIADSYTSAQSTRNADVAYIDGAKFKEFYNQNEGTVVVECDEVGVLLTSGSRVVTSFGNPSLPFGSSGSYMHLNQPTNNSAHRVWAVSGYTTTILDANTTINGKSAFSYKNGGVFSSATSSAVESTASGVVPIKNNTVLAIGGVYAWSSSSFGSQMRGSIKRLTYYPKQLSDTQLQLLSGE